MARPVVIVVVEHVDWAPSFVVDWSIVAPFGPRGKAGIWEGRKEDRPLSHGFGFSSEPEGLRVSSSLIGRCRLVRNLAVVGGVFKKCTSRRLPSASEHGERRACFNWVPPQSKTISPTTKTHVGNYNNNNITRRISLSVAIKQPITCLSSLTGKGGGRVIAINNC